MFVSPDDEIAKNGNNIHPYRYINMLLKSSLKMLTLPTVYFLFSISYVYENQTLSHYVASQYTGGVQLYITELTNDEGKVQLKSNFLIIK